MSEASFASLGPRLLARKGGAKPAMRPQFTPLPEDVASIAALAEEQLEDLGWNDMGADRNPSDASKDCSLLALNNPLSKETDDIEEFGEPAITADIVPLNALNSRLSAANEDSFEVIIEGANSPLMHGQQKRLARRVLAEASKPISGRVRANKSKRAAFTLRLDTDRHLKLRLAATMKGLSAQALVTEALDALLNSIEELDTLVERMKRD